MQHIVFYAVAIFALILWGWHHCSVRWIYRSDAIAINNTRSHSQPAAETQPQSNENEPNYVRSLISRNKGGIIGLLALIAAFIVSAFAIDGFFESRNILSVLVFAAFIIIAFILNKYVKINTECIYRNHRFDRTFYHRLAGGGGLPFHPEHQVHAGFCIFPRYGVHRTNVGCIARGVGSVDTVCHRFFKYRPHVSADPGGSPLDSVCRDFADRGRYSAQSTVY